MATAPTAVAEPAALLALLERLGIPHETVSHRPVFTVDEGRDLHGAIPGAHTKNLFLRDGKRRFFLVTACADTRVDLKTLPSVIGASGRLSFGTAEQLLLRLGVTPGSVTIFALVNDHDRAVTPVLDRRLLGWPRINGHPLVNSMTTGVAPRDLLRFLAALGREPCIADLGGQTEATTGREDAACGC